MRVYSTQKHLQEMIYYICTLLAAGRNLQALINVRPVNLIWGVIKTGDTN
jgi:hypothetical protein